MARISFDCPMCGREVRIEEREFKTARQFTCARCSTTIDLEPRRPTARKAPRGA